MTERSRKTAKINSFFCQTTESDQTMILTLSLTAQMPHFSIRLLSSFPSLIKFKIYSQCTYVCTWNGTKYSQTRRGRNQPQYFWNQHPKGWAKVPQLNDIRIIILIQWSFKMLVHNFMKYPYQNNSQWIILNFS